MNTSSGEMEDDFDETKAQVTPWTRRSAERDEKTEEETVYDDSWLAAWVFEVLSTQIMAFYVLGISLDAAVAAVPQSEVRASSIIGILFSSIAILGAVSWLICKSYYILKNHFARPCMEKRMAMAVRQASTCFFLILSCGLASSLENFAMRQYTSIMILVIVTCTNFSALIDIWRDRVYYRYCLYGSEEGQFYDGNFSKRSPLNALQYALKVSRFDTIACIFCFVNVPLTLIVWLLIFLL